MRKVTSAGGIIVDGNHLLLIQLESKLYAIPKGHIEPGESIEQTAIREVEEETAVKPEVIMYLGDFTRLSKESTGETVKKTVKIYKLRKLGLSKLNPDENSKWVEAKFAINNMHFQEESIFIKEHLAELIGA